MVRKKRVVIPLYEHYLTVILIKPDDKKAEKEYDFPQHAGAVTYTTGNHVEIVFRENDVLAHYIVHECFHATYYILNSIGMKLGKHSEEAYAYLLHWFYDTVTKQLIRWNQEIKLSLDKK